MCDDAIALLNHTYLNIVIFLDKLMLLFLIAKSFFHTQLSFYR